MRRRSLIRLLLPPVLIAASVLVAVGCGVLNPDLLGAAGVSNTGTTSLINGMVVLMLINETGVSTSAVLVSSKTDNTGATTTSNTTLTAAAHDHIVLVNDCQINQIQVNTANSPACCAICAARTFRNGCAPGTLVPRAKASEALA